MLEKGILIYTNYEMGWGISSVDDMQYVIS